MDAPLGLTDLVLASVRNVFTEQPKIASADAKSELALVYEKVGIHLSRYKSGKLPKAFKVIPSLKNWEEVLALTRPELWTPNATYEATCVFISNLSPGMAQRFLTTILLPKVRADIRQNKTLNPHLYSSLKKSIYKPAAFFKGIVYSLCQEGNCTLKEATVVASILAKISVPSLHSAAALLSLTQLPYSGPQSIFIKTLLDKRHAIPCRVVAALVDYFQQSLGQAQGEKLPVLWHQSLLIFVQRYKLELSLDQKKIITDLISCKPNEAIAKEIIRELDSVASCMETS